jgi:hypothetical protein
MSCIQYWPWLRFSMERSSGIRAMTFHRFAKLVLPNGGLKFLTGFDYLNVHIVAPNNSFK